MNWIKQKILSLLSREIRNAYLARDKAEKHSTAYKMMLDRALNEIEVIGDIANHWRQEADAKNKLFCDIIKEVEGAEDLHNLRQVVRLMAYRAENSAIIVQGSGEDPNPEEEPMEQDRR